MSRYFTQRPRHTQPPHHIARTGKMVVPRADYDPLDWNPLIPNIDVPEHEESFTGLLDSRGEEIWRSPRPMGFGRDKEWA